MLRAMSASTHRLYFLLQRAAHRLKTEADARLMAASGLSTAQAAVLVLVCEDEPVTQKALAERLQQTEAAMTAMVHRLVKLGFLHRERADTDRRSWQVRATPAGRAALERTRAPFGTINAALDAQLSPQESAALAAMAHRILTAFEDDQ